MSIHLRSRLGKFLLGIIAAVSLALALAIAMMRPPLGDLLQLALLFGITGGASALLGFFSHRLGWWRKLPRLSHTLTLGYALAAALTLLNVWITARLMFINAHDLALAGLLLLFAGGISISFGYFLSGSITQTLRDLVRGAEQVAQGNFSVQVAAPGQDEVAQLARGFNVMTARLARVDAETRALDAARRDLVAWASHDLRTPLASLRAMLDALADGVVADPETVGRYLRQSQNEIARMSALIDNLFELAQIDTGHLVLQCGASSLSDLVSDTLETFTARARERGVLLNGAVAADVDPVWMAPDKISRVLANMLENAVRHTPSGGQILLSAATQNGSVHITIADSGPGIDPDDLPHIFDRFYRGEKSRQRDGFSGAGLGLTIAKGIVEAHGGRIWAESKPGGGAKFHVSLPKTGGSAEAPV
ncbi:MAG: HAMP domain-containing protein [Chloroflexi bacterium]|nr:HAMP domain-containing protein [Chloroflexota bacterium]